MWIRKSGPMMKKPVATGNGSTSRKRKHTTARKEKGVVEFDEEPSWQDYDDDVTVSSIELTSRLNVVSERNEDERVFMKVCSLSARIINAPLVAVLLR